MLSSMPCHAGPIPAGAGETWGYVFQQARRGAYPRWRGGNQWRADTGSARWGLSPLARGKHFRRDGRAFCVGPIPAGAGETPPTLPRSRIPRAYPRWRGGNPSKSAYPRDRTGLSPLARGKPTLAKCRASFPGPIPAGAGETRRRPGCSAGCTAYPRWRGGNDDLDGELCAIGGLSPLARGKLGAVLARVVLAGPIPAGAGETGRSSTLTSATRAYPRWRGGNFARTPINAPKKGLSPLARGKRFRHHDGRADQGPIPAGAGETPPQSAVRERATAYPRWRGGNRYALPATL